MTLNHSKTYLETCYATAKRILRAVGEDASAFDVFTKRQKQDIFRLAILPPRVAAAPGHLVPRHYIRYLQEEVIMILKREYFNKEEGVTLLDIATVGMPMVAAFKNESHMILLSELQRETKERLRKAFESQEVVTKFHADITRRLKVTLMMLSQPNFRIYGQGEIHYQHSGRTGLYEVMYITTHESQSIRFNYHNRERIAYRIATGQYLKIPYRGATISMKKIFPNIKNDRKLNIYIQSHAMHRFKERIDTVYPLLRNEFFIISLMTVQRIVSGPCGVPLIACIVPVDDTEKTVGYFTFTIDGNNLLVLTLLPLLSADVPEGRVLYNRLHLSLADLKYLGMDKLSFFYDIDIKQIPLLKQVLHDELHLDYFHTIYNSFRDKDAPFNEKKTLFVKNFFRKIEEYSANLSD